jgi:cytochrome c biogenesis protein ResB
VQRTPFHVAHQGLNDHELQVAFHYALSALCPQLNFMSNHLYQRTLRQQQQQQQPANTQQSNMQSGSTRSPNARAQIQIRTDTRGGPAQTITLLPPSSRTQDITNVQANAQQQTQTQQSPPHKNVFPIRLGFCSTHFSDHSIGKIMYESITRAAMAGVRTGEFEVFVFYIDHTVSQEPTTGRYTRRPNNEQSGITRNFLDAFGDAHFFFLPASISAARGICVLICGIVISMCGLFVVFACVCVQRRLPRMSWTFFFSPIWVWISPHMEWPIPGLQLIRYYYPACLHSRSELTVLLLCVCRRRGGVTLSHPDCQPSTSTSDWKPR